jgi:plastocyanin
MKAWLNVAAALLTTTALSTAVSTSALAHHSNSAFDPEKVTVLKGTVTQWLWTNPHVWIHLAVDDGNGAKTEWQIEGRPPGVLARSGWSRTIFKPGDTITVDFSPARDGSHTGLATRVTLADGTVLSQSSPQ